MTQEMLGGCAQQERSSGIGGICQRPCSWGAGRSSRPATSVPAHPLPPLPWSADPGPFLPGLHGAPGQVGGPLGGRDAVLTEPPSLPQGRGGCRVPRATLSPLSPPPLLPQSPLGTSSRSEGPPPTEVNVCPPSIGPGGGAGTGLPWARWCFPSLLPVWSAGWLACALVLGRAIKINID